MNQPFNPPTDIPLDKVLNLRSQGFSDPQIVEALQREGYRTDQIYNAINQSDVKSGVEQVQPAMPPPPIQPSMPSPANQSTSDFSQDNEEFAGQNETVEEIAESIIEEKWKDIEKQIDKFDEWKAQTEAKMNSIEKGFENIKEDFDKLHTAVLGKVSEYDQNIVNLGAEIKAMEKVFQKLLPTFTDNVNELSRITEKMKKK